MEKIEFEMWGLQLLEPMALILNLVMSFQSFLYYQKIRASFASPFSAYFSKFFLFISISTFFAAWSHLFYNYLGLVGKIPGWATSIISISMLEYAMVIYLYPKGNILLKSIIALLMASAFGLLIFELKFLWVAIHTALGLVLFLGMPFSFRIIKGEEKASFFFWGFISMLMTLPVELIRLNLHPWFQHHEISHVFMICALYCFSKGVRQTELISSQVKV
jgi:hypothetical protein|tara:strand:+ start:384 stop:1040 length:657 start_codon:yes stop_codon:yes gene_type:complete